MQGAKNYLFLPAIFLMAFSCDKTVAPEPAPTVEEKALLVGNGLPADACGAHLELNYKADGAVPGEVALPTDATRAEFDKIIAAEETKQVSGVWMGQKIVTIKYQRTTNTGTLECGWGKKQTVPLVALSSIQ
jgi:hypothetical protein